MSENVSESDVYSPTVIVPQVGDTTYPSTVPQGMGELANRANFLIRRLRGQGTTETLSESAAIASEDNIIVPADSVMGGGNLLKAAFVATANRIKHLKSRAHGTQNFELFVSPVPSNTGGWSIFTSTSVRIEQTDTSAVATATYFVPYTYFGFGSTTTLLKVTALVRGVGHASLPTVMPKIQVYSKNRSHGDFGGGTVTEIGSEQEDESANTTQYDTFHPITWNAPADTLVSDLGLLTVVLSGEDATGSEDFQVHGIVVEFDPN